MANDFLMVNLLNNRKLLRDIESIPSIVQELLREKIKAWTEELKEVVLDNIRSKLKSKSGKLEDAVDIGFTEDGLRLEGHVFIAGVPYAQAQEKGAIIRPHWIFPVNAKTLAFYAASGDKVFAARVWHPGGIIPPHYFMRDAYRYMSPRITRRLRYYIVERIRNRMGKL